MTRWFFHAKIHRATVTEAEPDYIGSCTIDADLLEKTGLEPGEKVLVVAMNGARLETYIIRGAPGSGVICMNGPTARLIPKGEIVIIMGFALSDGPIEAKSILVDDDNKFVKYLTEAEGKTAED